MGDNLIVAGVPRSGTSLTMRIAKEAGENIIGYEFPRLHRIKEARKQGEDESDYHYAARMYMLSGDPKQSDEAMAKHKDMNPNGFWEHPMFTVKGIREGADIFADDIKKLKEGGCCIKLVNSGLLASEQKYIGKVIYLVRHPYDVAKSQERLERERKFTLKDGREVDLFKGSRINDPHFYIQCVLQFAKWRKDNPNIPVLYVDYNSLISNPEKELNKICKFAKNTQWFHAGMDVINPKLRRSEQGREYRPGLWEEAIDMYVLLMSEDWDGMLEFADNKKTWFAKRNLNFFCTRLHAPVNYMNCWSCKVEMDEEYILNGIKRAKINGWDWRNEPCIFECGFDPDDEHPLYIEESIRKNHWKKCDV